MWITKNLDNSLILKIYEFCNLIYFHCFFLYFNYNTLDLNKMGCAVKMIVSDVLDFYQKYFYVLLAKSRAERWFLVFDSDWVKIWYEDESTENTVQIFSHQILVRKLRYLELLRMFNKNHKVWTGVLKLQVKRKWL
jgi:hypothetical protein